MRTRQRLLIVTVWALFVSALLAFLVSRNQPAPERETTPPPAAVAATPTATATPSPEATPPRLSRREIDQQSRLTPAEAAAERATGRRYRLLELLPLELAGARLDIAGTTSRRPQLTLTGTEARNVLAHALQATGDKASSYALTGPGGETIKPASPREPENTPVAVAAAYTAVNGTWGPATSSAQTRRQASLSTGSLRGGLKQRPTTTEDTQITVVLATRIASRSPRTARVELTTDTYTYRGGGANNSRENWLADLTNTQAGWKVHAYTVDPQEEAP